VKPAALFPGVFGLFAALLGCDDPLLEAQRIETTRVLGARVEVAGDATRPWPRPEETVAVTWLVADPRPSPALSWDFAACLGESTLRGVPRCRTAPFARARSGAPSQVAPSFSFAAPAEASLEGSDRVVVRGAVCADAEVALADPLEQTSCGGDLTLVVLDIRIERADLSNRNPTLGDETLSFDGAPWPAPANDLLVREDCVPAQQAPELPVVSADGAAHRFRVGLSADDRESLDTIEGEFPETLQVSHFATLGRLERAISVIEPVAPEPIVQVAWEAPGPGLSSGRVVRFYFVVRDLRGGTDWVVRTACVVP
jgi:hypothetical protein